MPKEIRIYVYEMTSNDYCIDMFHAHDLANPIDTMIYTMMLIDHSRTMGWERMNKFDGVSFIFTIKPEAMPEEVQLFSPKIFVSNIFIRDFIGLPNSNYPANM